PGEAAFEEAVDIELAAGGINHERDVVPLIVVVAGEVEGAAAAAVDRARQIAQVPGAEVAVIHEHLIAVEGVGDVFVHDAVDAARRIRLDPDRSGQRIGIERDRKSTRLNSSHEWISYAVFCLKKKTIIKQFTQEFN